MTTEDPGPDFDDDGDPDDGDSDEWDNDDRGHEPSGGADVGPSDARLHEGLEHVQRAAREMIAASRSLLDVAEELIEDPGTLGRLARLIGGASRSSHRVARDPGRHDDGDDPPVERIPVS